MTVSAASGEAGKNKSIRVVHVVLSLEVGGLERVVQHLAREGVARGQDVSVICLEKLGFLAPQVEAAGARVMTVSKPPGLTPKLITTLRGVFREMKPDVVHTHQIGALLYAGPAAHREGVRGIVHTEHINNVAKVSSLNLRLRMRGLWWFATRYAKSFICVSKDIAAAAERWVPKEKISVIDNGIQVSVFDESNSRDEIREKMGIPREAMVVGQVARLNEVKCPDLLIRAFAAVRGEAHLLLVGDGPMRAELERLVGKLGLKDCVHFAGYQAEPHRFLQALDVFALPSRLEGMPLAILEAWAARLPVVATRVGGVPDVVKDGETGLLIPAMDQGALEAALKSLLGSRELREKLGAAGRWCVETQYDTTRMARLYAERYEAAMRAREQPSVLLE